MDISQFSEADIREEVIAPLLRLMGYQSGTTNDIRRELSLRYPHDSLGRKKAGLDPVLRGRADYVCEVDRRIRWTIEAKPPSPELTEHDVQQAYTYARHPEVRAVYFCVCNGRRLLVYATESAPETPALVDVDCADIRLAAEKLEPLLGPDSMRRRFADVSGPTVKPIGPGLLSFAQIVGGHIVFDTSTPRIPMVEGLMVTVTSGAIQRGAENKLVAYFDTLAPFSALQKTNERLGVARFEASTLATSLSTNESSPNVFEEVLNVRIPRGEPILNMLTWNEEPMPFDVDFKAEVRGIATLSGLSLGGRFEADYTYSFLQGDVCQKQKFALRGHFRLQLR